jgi:probable rRNA maturation factor
LGVTAINLQRKVPVNISRLICHAQLALSAVKKTDFDLSLVIVNDQRMRSLNRSYLGKSRTTDVLSFDAEIPLPRGIRNPLLGEIIISAPKAMRQAKQQKIDFDDEMTNLAIHGICHLLGYDHELGEKESRKMKAMEQKIASMIRQSDKTLLAPDDIGGKITGQPGQRKRKS